MISLITGEVHSVSINRIVIVAGGIGYDLHTTSRTSTTLRHGMATTVHTTLVVREDSLTLYGFADEDERDVFAAMTTVPGVGPRTALAAVDVLAPDELRRAVADKDETTLTKIPGVGKKSAQKLIINIGDKLGAPTTPAAPTPSGDTISALVVEALVSLGWNERQAREAVAPFAGSGMTQSDMLRAALIALRTDSREETR